MAVKTNKDKMGKVAFSLFNTVGNSYMPHSAQAETVWLALIEANKKRVPTIQCFLLAPSSQNVDSKENLTG